MLTVSQHLKLVAVPGDKYSREKLMKTKDKLVEFREAANVLDKTRVDSGEEAHSWWWYWEGFCELWSWLWEWPWRLSIPCTGCCCYHEHTRLQDLQVD